MLNPASCALELGLVLGSYALLALMVNSFDVDLPPDRKDSHYIRTMPTLSSMLT